MANEQTLGVASFKIGNFLYKYQDDQSSQELNNKVDKIAGKSLSTNDFTNEDKNKLDGIEQEAQKNEQVDTALDSSSTHPVQNRVIKNYVDTKIAEVNALATTTTPGKIIVGDNLSIFEGRLSAPAPYVLPAATSASSPNPALGGIIVGEHLEIDENGVLNAVVGGGGGPTVKDDLYVNSGTTQETNITLLHDYDGYDLLYFTIVKTVNNVSSKIVSSIETSKIEQNDIIQISGGESSSDWCQYEVTDVTSLTLVNVPSADIYLESIVGIELGSGNGVSYLEDLEDTTITNPTDGQILKYDDQSETWVNENLDTGINYSTTEQVIGTWIDGKPLYRKVISANSIAADSLSAALVSNVDFFATEFINCHDDTSNAIFSPSTISTYNIAGADTIYATVTKTIDNELKILNVNHVDTLTVIASVIYTKTTDTSS